MLETGSRKQETGRETEIEVEVEVEEDNCLCDRAFLH